MTTAAIANQIHGRLNIMTSVCKAHLNTAPKFDARRV
jgi:hypothetical protein